MTRSLTITDFLIRLKATYTNTVTDGTVVTDPFDFTFADTLANGTDADQANLLWHSGSRTLSSGASEDIDVYDLDTLDLGAGAGKDSLGLSFASASIVMLVVVSSATSAGTLRVGAKGGTDCWNSLFDGDDNAKLVVRPGGMAMAYAPDATAYAVADTTNHELKMQAFSGDVTYDIIVVARSA